jgi:hypothetical protein
MKTDVTVVTPFCRHGEKGESKPWPSACAYCASAKAGIPPDQLQEVAWLVYQQFGRSYGGHGCEACGKRDEPYMLKNHLWKRVTKGTGEKYLCLACVESRLGTPLELSHFTPYMINYGMLPGFDVRTYLQKKTEGTVK